MKIKLLSQLSPNVGFALLFPYLMKINEKRPVRLQQLRYIVTYHIIKYIKKVFSVYDSALHQKCTIKMFFLYFFLLVWFVQEDNLSKLSNVEKLIRTFKCHDGKIDYICSRWKAIYLCNYTDHKFIYSHKQYHILLIK